MEQRVIFFVVLRVAEISAVTDALRHELQLGPDELMLARDLRGRE